jgi:hypothetical protein
MNKKRTRDDLSLSSTSSILGVENASLARANFFVQDVLDFSSQYGKEASKSYTVTNIKSGPNHFPKYGDFLESCVLVRPLFKAYLFPN